MVSLPMCRVLRIAPSTWHEHVRRRADPDLRSTRAKEDEQLSEEIVSVHKKNFGVYGAKKVPRFAQSLRDQLNREGFKVGRDRVARLMGRLGLEGVVRGKVVKTTTPDKAEANYYAALENIKMAEQDSSNQPSGKPCAVQIGQRAGPTSGAGSRGHKTYFKVDQFNGPGSNS